MKSSFVRGSAAAVVTALLLATAPAALAGGKPQMGTFGIDLTAKDAAVKPGDDFFAFANGTWLKTDQIPADRARFGAFDQLAQQSENRSRAILEEAMKDPKSQLGNFYASFLDEARVEKLGIAPIQGELNRIARIKSRKDVEAQIIHNINTGVTAPLFGFVGQDPKDATRYIVQLNQSGLGLPDKDFYFNTEKRFEDIRTRYKQHITTLLTLAKVADAQAKAEAIFNLEKQIAEVHWTRVENRDRDKTYNLRTLAQLTSDLPGVNWANLLNQTKMSAQDAYVVRQPSAIRGIAKIVSEANIDTLKAYFTFHLLSDAAPYLPKVFADEAFAFRQQTLQGVPQQAPRWRRGVNLINGLMGEAVGKVWVERHFTPEAKHRMDQLVANVKTAFGQRIDQLDWMSPETKKEARTKLANFNTKIGFPSKWTDYSKVVIKRDDLIGNIKRAGEFELNRNKARLGKPVDREEWFMPPQTVNAYYSPSMNEIVFPAAILQPPFFDPYADDAVNYGAIGGVIGHEIGHGFDDQGRKSDGKGNLREWWTSEDDVRFRQRSDRLVEQYNAFCPLPPTGCVNGRLALGENIGDLGGLQVAYVAYKLSLGGKPAAVIDGYTGEQRFFMAWAQVWKAQQREASLRQQLTVGPHSPAQFRTNGVVRNLDAWYEAFNVQPGDKLYLPPDQRVRIW
jgi:putative endopeptidase